MGLRLVAGCARRGAWQLNPACVFIFAAACLLEVAYCLLWRVSPYRTLVSGAVKTCGAVAAVFAVDPSPSFAFLGALFLALFLWEIGGQNIPNDLTDLEEDRRMNARTIPVRLRGRPVDRRSRWRRSRWRFRSPRRSSCSARWSTTRCSRLAALAVGAKLLLLPGLRLERDRDRAAAMALFN